MERFDIAIVGAGIAGASLAYELARRRAGMAVVLLEKEAMPGLHSTGRSVSVLTAATGNPAVRALTMASLPFFDAPPSGFADHPLLARRGCLVYGRPGREQAIRERHTALGTHLRHLRLLDAAGVRQVSPGLRDGYGPAGVFDSDARDIDTDALLQGCLRAFRRAGGQIRTGAEVLELRRSGGWWSVGANAGELSAHIVVNAAGAWVDQVAALAGLAPLGFCALRRTVVAFDPPPACPPGMEPGSWPLTIDIDEALYFKGDSGRIVASPADETPVVPGDARPDDLDVAVAMDRFEQATGLDVRRLTSRWAGLRTFARDRTPVIGLDPRLPGFFWLAGQGGGGIKTAPAMARCAADLLLGAARFPEDVRNLGVDVADLSPARLAK